MLTNKGCSYQGLMLTIFFFGIFTSVLAQQPTADRNGVFLVKDLQELVLLNHPIVKQAGLLSKEAQARVLQSLGKFDPALMASFGKKSFGGTDYYNHWDSELKVPLWLGGADLNLGYDRNVGVYNNPETRTSSTGLSGVGLTIPLGQGLLIDARRNTLRQAKIMVGYADAEKVAQINSVWYNAMKDYWSWYFAFEQRKFTKEGVELAQKRFRAIREQVILGDKPPIDSVEAAIVLQDREIQLQESSVQLTNSRLLLSNHLWSSAGKPQELPADAVPEEKLETETTVEKLRLDTLILQAADNHPEILKIKSQSAKLEIEQKYRLEMLKPKLNVKGSFLAGRRDFSDIPNNYDFRLANYKVGIDFSFPLFLREERGKLREVRIQQAEVAYGLQQTTREIQTDVMTAFTEMKAVQTQVTLLTKNVENQRALVNGELQKFALGESNLFLINTRETKLMDMLVKRAKLISNFQKTIADLYYRAGKRRQY
ncbi:TolC family protein [Pedobacter sp. CFBP9032]|uniref:TolC family protein n=1 Tax=Pedobacter sp. CFBP9032 TaxID=3096539 RepID=UPI002A6AD307|nr:TolC family protein [Pedobacter sp. CFBP9032]MDY0907097.1 TolC family protein [Pedobacter sp. CFBP9032]